MGQVIGQLHPRRRRAGVRTGPHPQPDRHHHAHLLDISQVRVMRGIPGDVSRVITEGEPIAQLMS